MPTLHVYFGIRIFFYGKDHTPIHVHGRYQGKESKAEILTKKGEIIGIRYKDVLNRPPLPDQQLRDFKKLVAHEAENIVTLWNEYRLTEKHIEPQLITRRLR